MMPSTALVMTAPDQLVRRDVRLYRGAIINPCSWAGKCADTPFMNDREKRQSIIEACLRMNALGINQGTSGNISLRHSDGMLITPTSTPYEAMQPEQIVYMHLDGSHDPAQRTSSEWRFHRDILQARPDVNAVVHSHPRLTPHSAPRSCRNMPCAAARQAGLPVGASRHDRDRTITVEGNVARGR